MVGVAGGLVLVTTLVAANEYRKEMNGPRRIGRNWFATELPSEWRDSKYRYNTSRRDYDNYDDDYDAVVRRPVNVWRGGKSKRKTRRNKN